MTHEEFERIVKTIPTFSNRVKMKNYHRSLIQQIATLETINLALVQKRAELEDLERQLTDEHERSKAWQEFRQLVQLHHACPPDISADFIRAIMAVLKEE